MRVELARPQLATRRGIERVDIRAGIAEVDGVFRHPLIPGPSTHPAHPELVEGELGSLRMYLSKDERALGLCSCFDRLSTSVLHVTEDQCGSHPALRRERPVDAAGFRVERVDR